MVEYQLAQFIKEPAELMPNRILVLMYLLDVHPGDDTLIKVKGMLIVSLGNVNCRLTNGEPLYDAYTTYLPMRM